MLTGVGTYAFAQVAWGEELSDVESLTTLTTSITAIAASIPLGFLIYQVYYWMYSPFFLMVVTRDRGREALIGLPPEVLDRLRTLFDARLDVRRHHKRLTIPVLRRLKVVQRFMVRRLKLFRLDEDLLRAHYKDPSLTPDGEFERDQRSLRRIYKDNWYENWDAFRALLELVATRGNRPEIQKNFTSLYDIYHSLGASRLAVLLGAAAGVLYLGGAHRAEIQEHPVPSAVGLVAIVMFASLLAWVIHRTHLATWKSAIAKVHLDLTSYFQTSPEFVELLPEARKPTPRIELRGGDQRMREYERPLLPNAVRPSVRRLLGDIGTIEWAERTGGILDRRQMARFQAATALSIGFDLGRIFSSRRSRGGAGLDPSEVEIPKTTFPREIEKACASLPPMIREHGYRSYIFGRTLAAAEEVDCDEEALFAACMLHDYAFSDKGQIGGQCFTLASVEAARPLLQGSSLSDERQRDVLDAITLHLNPVVDLEQGAVQRYTHGGVLLDVLGQRASGLDPEGLERAVASHPRYGFTVHGGTLLKEHGRIVRRSRAQAMFRCGFGAALRTSRWLEIDRD